MSRTLSEMFKEIVEFKLGYKVTAVKIYKVPNNNLGDIKVMSAVAAKEIDIYRLAELIKTDRLYPKYRDYSVDCTSYDAGVFKIWIIKQETI